MAQIREFESTTESYFILDGVSYPKVYEAMLDNGYSDTKIKLVGTNRDTTPLVFSTEYTNIRVDGDSFDTALEAISRLNQIVFSKGGGSGTGGATNVITEDSDTVIFTGNGTAGNPLSAESVGGGTNNSDTIAKTIEVTLDDLEVATEEEVTPQIIADYFNSLGLVKSEKDFYIIKVTTPEPPEPILNFFDVTGNWDLTTEGDGSTHAPVTDAESFKTWLESGWTTEQYDSSNSFADVVVSDFSLVDGRLTANVTTSGGDYFALEGLEITQVNSVSIGDFKTLGLAYNQLTTFNPTIPLPTGLEKLNLSSNQITNFNPTIPLPTGLQVLDLGNNQIIDWSLSEPWANSLPTGTTYIGTEGNPTSSNGTTFESILTAKGYTVIY